MNTTNLNSELLSADARGRKNIPFAVFAVIVVHVVLFLVLLIAAGCRAKARARRMIENGPQMAEKVEKSNGGPLTQAELPAVTKAAPKITSTAEPVNAEPVVSRASEPARPRAIHKRADRSAPAKTVSAKSGLYYVVKSGDTVEKIAKRHGTTVQAIKLENNLKNDLLRPGQKLRVTVMSAGKAKRSDEA